jgi:hypothetical protein
MLARRHVLARETGIPSPHPPAIRVIFTEKNNFFDPKDSSPPAV